MARIDGIPLGPDSLNQLTPYAAFEPAATRETSLSLRVNSSEDRVAAIYETCDDHEGRICGKALFLFPQLTVDPAKKEIRLGDVRVASYGVAGVRLDQGYTLRSEPVEVVEDPGFERLRVTRIRVFLETNS